MNDQCIQSALPKTGLMCVNYNNSFTIFSQRVSGKGSKKWGSGSISKISTLQPPSFEAHNPNPPPFLQGCLKCENSQLRIKMDNFRQGNLIWHYTSLTKTSMAEQWCEKEPTLFTINFGAINFGDNIFGGINFGKNLTIHRISIEIRSLKIFGVTNFRLGTSSPKLFHTEIYRK